jgi:hypothetical protein
VAIFVKFINVHTVLSHCADSTLSLSNSWKHHDFPTPKTARRLRGSSLGDTDDDIWVQATDFPPVLDCTYVPMKHLVIVILFLWAAFHFGGSFLSTDDRETAAAFGRLVEAPQRLLGNPYSNGYFYLFGLTAAATLDPARTGYEIWVEETEDARRGESAEQRATRADLVFAVPETTSPAWEADDPLKEFQKNDAAFLSAKQQYGTLVSRYEHWIGMPFDDWGFGRRVTPLGPELLAVHRLYVADGFSTGTVDGLERLHKDLNVWRSILREAKTIDTKVLAQIVMTDDLLLLSRILGKPTVDKAILTMGLQLTLPLSAPEYSLRWPIRHQLALAMKGRTAGITGDREQERRRRYEGWLMKMGRLPHDAFEGIVHPPARSAARNFQWTQATAAYAAYYDAVIQASESNARRLPGMQDVAGMIHRGWLESMLNSRPVEPEWELFHGELIETDTRLRLASLQIQLRHPSPQTAVPARLAEVGSQYFDPFTGLPMLWSPTQQKLYSVGRDRLDDGGDPTFDISVPAVVGQAVAGPTQAKSTGPAAPRSSRR